jgi:putative intracellular protease/amidase
MDMQDYMDIVLTKGTELLEQTNTLPLVRALNAVREAKARANARRAVAFIGFNNLRDTANALNAALGHPFLEADRLLFVRKECRITFTYTEEAAENNTRDLYSALEAEGDTAVVRTLACNCNALKTADATVLFLPGGNAANFDMHTLNAQFDFAFVVTSALAALNENEKQFLTETAQPVIGGNRVALALADVDLISMDDLTAINEHANKVLNRVFQTKIPLLCDGSDELKAFAGALLTDLDNYYSHTVKQVTRLGAAAVRESFDEFKTRVSISAEEIRTAIATLNERKANFGQKAEALCHMAQIFIEGNVKVPLLNEMRSYNEQIKEKAFTGIENMKGKAIEKESLNNQLDENFKTAWVRFFNAQAATIKELFEDEAKHIEAQIKIDTDELFNGFRPDVLKLMNADTAAPAFSGTAKDIDGLKKPLNLSNLLVFATVPLVFINLPVAIFTAVSAFLLKKRDKFMARDDMQAFSQARINDIGDGYYNAYAAEIEGNMAEATASLKQSITGAYKHLVDNALSNLHALQRSEAERGEQQKFIDTFPIETFAAPTETEE